MSDCYCINDTKLVFIVAVDFGNKLQSVTVVITDLRNVRVNPNSQNVMYQTHQTECSVVTLLCC
jgi:hypothetical protein